MNESSDIPIKTQSRLRPLARRTVITLLRVYFIVCCIVYLAQDWLAFPGKTSQGKPETQIEYGGDTETLHLTTATGIPIAAVFGDSHRPNSPTILYFYGNASSVAWSEGEFDHFRQLGCNVLIPDLSGFGASGGKASEQNFYATADAAWNYLQTRPGIDKTKIIVVGWSMGAAVAVDLASRKPVAGLAVFNAYTTLPAMARKLVPWLPTGFLLKYEFDNQTKIAGIRCPIFICNGKLDTLIPLDMSDQLAAVAGGRVTRLTIGSADHNSIFIAEPQLIWHNFGGWVQQASPE